MEKEDYVMFQELRFFDAKRFMQRMNLLSREGKLALENAVVDSLAERTEFGADIGLRIKSLLVCHKGQEVKTIGEITYEQGLMDGSESLPSYENMLMITEEPILIQMRMTIPKTTMKILLRPDGKECIQSLRYDRQRIIGNRGWIRYSGFNEVMFTLDLVRDNVKINRESFN